MEKTKTVERESEDLMHIESSIQELELTLKEREEIFSRTREDLHDTIVTIREEIASESSIKTQETLSKFDVVQFFEENVYIEDGMYKINHEAIYFVLKSLKLLNTRYYDLSGANELLRKAKQEQQVQYQRRIMLLK